MNPSIPITQSAFDKKPRKHINANMIAGRGKLATCRIKVVDKKNGRVVVDQEGDSLVGNYAKVLKMMMAQQYSLRAPSNMDDRTLMRFVAEQTTTVTVYDITKTNPAVIKVTANLGTDTGLCCTIANAAGCTDVNRMGGVYYLDYKTYTGGYWEYYLYNDEAKTDAVDATGWTGTYTVSSARVIQGYGAYMYSDDEWLNQARIVLGTGTTANALDQQTLENQIINGASAGQLNYQSYLIDEPVITASAGTIQFTRDFNNNSGGNITVEEVGVVARAYAESGEPGYTTHDEFLLARDLTTFTVPDGDTYTVTFEWQVTISAEKGYMTQFAQLMYRQFSGLPRSAWMISNADSGNDGPYAKQLSAQEASGWLKYPYVGIMVGTGSGAIDITDYDLDTRVLYGEDGDSGTLRMFGAVTTEMTFSGNVASFQVVKLFQNVSGGSIVISELGAVVAAQNNFDQHMITRHLHDGAGGRPSSVTLADDEILVASITFGVDIS